MVCARFGGTISVDNGYIGLSKAGLSLTRLEPQPSKAHCSGSSPRKKFFVKNRPHSISKCRRMFGNLLNCRACNSHKNSQHSAIGFCYAVAASKVNIYRSFKAVSEHMYAP